MLCYLVKRLCCGLKDCAMLKCIKTILKGCQFYWSKALQMLSFIINQCSFNTYQHGLSGKATWSKCMELYWSIWDMMQSLKAVHFDQVIQHWIHNSLPLYITNSCHLWWCCMLQWSSETEESIALLCQLCSTCYTAVQIKNCTSVIKVATMKSTDDFLSCKGSHHVQPPSYAFHCEWNTKEDTGKFVKNALHVLRYVKRHLSGWRDIKKWKNQASSLSHYQVTLVWRHQLVS